MFCMLMKVDHYMFLTNMIIHLHINSPIKNTLKYMKDMLIQLEYKSSKGFNILCIFVKKQSTYRDKWGYTAQFLLKEYLFLDPKYTRYNYLNLFHKLSMNLDIPYTFLIYHFYTSLQLYNLKYRYFKQSSKIQCYRKYIYLQRLRRLGSRRKLRKSSNLYSKL